MQPEEKLKKEIIINEKELKDLKNNIRNLKKFQGVIDQNLKKDITSITKILLGGAIILRASDIHLEPQEKEVLLRVRLDGLLHPVIKFEAKTYQKVLSRLKLLSGIKLNITSQPQDGRFSVILSNLEIEIRCSTLPSAYGETMVMRLLNPQNLVEIKDLGIREDMMPIFEKEIQRPNGMIISTGPTGSGKTTTLYAILKRLQNPEIKIITIEDPIEYHLEGISQTQVDPKRGYNFASGLRSIVRQDPDVILVGEIRDLETAQIALQAALTGHLVLSTLHTNDAAGAVARFQALGEKLVNIAPAINLVLGQRLLRKVCKKCVKMEKPSEKEMAILNKELRSLPKNIDIPPLKNLKIPKPQGCQDCNETGYQGRIGIFEFFLVDEEMEEFILKGPSISALRNKARKKGMVSMRQDGFIKVLQGKTTIEEVNRVTSA